MKRHLKKHAPRLVHLAKRIYHARSKNKLIGILILFFWFCCGLQIYSNIFVYPNTTLGSMDMSGKTRTYVKTYLDRLLSRQYTLTVQNRTYKYTYSELGIRVDTDMAISALYENNLQPFPLNIFKLFASGIARRHVEIPLVFTEDFYRFTAQTVYNFSDIPDEVFFDDQGKSVTYVENEEKYTIAEVPFKSLLESRIENNTIPLYPKLVKVTNERSMAVTDIAERIKSIFLQPLTVYIDLGGQTKSFILTERELADIARVTWSPDQTDAVIALNSSTAMYIINEHIKTSGVLARGNVATQKVLRDLEDTLTSRFNGHPSEAFTIRHDSGPNTDGSIALKYIEVDISQQKMYLFKDSKLVKSYRVSTGLEYPTPTGEFTVLNKAGNGYSRIYDVWMPWWMGFKYSDELHAYFGIHELPYKLSGDNIIRRPSNFIGSPNTGGCVALGVGDAQQVYQFADIGTKIAIYQ